MYDREFKNDIFARSPSALEVLARFRGIQSGYKYSEAFKIVRQFEPSQWVISIINKLKFWIIKTLIYFFLKWLYLLLEVMGSLGQIL